MYGDGMVLAEKRPPNVPEVCTKRRGCCHKWDILYHFLVFKRSKQGNSEYRGNSCRLASV